MKRALLILTAACLLLPLFAFFGCEQGKTARNEYAIAARYEGGVLSAEMEFTYYNEGDSETEFLEFNLYGNAYREGALYQPVAAAYSASAYYGGKSYGEMQISQVTPCKKWEICGDDENILRVELAEPVASGESAEICVEYTLTLARVNHRTGVTCRSVNLGNFYPILCARGKDGGFYRCEYYANGDPFYSECADYTVSFTADAEYTVALSGQVTGETVAGGKKTTEAELFGARDFAVVLGEGYSVAQDTVGGVSVLYYYYDDIDPQARLGLIADCFSYFSEKFGAYPYKAFSAVQTGFCYGGMEYPGLVMLSDALSEKNYSYTAVHETAHQWWYAAVGNNQLEEAWLDEGLAEYSSYLFFEENPSYGLRAEELLASAKRAYKAFYDVHSQVFGKADTSMSRKISEFGTHEYVAVAYDKGMILFDTLREALGERRFFAGLRRYYAENAGKIASREELKSAFGNAGASGVVDSFVDGTAIV